MSRDKRHILTDTKGNLVHAVIHTADIQDRDGAPLVLTEIICRFPWLRHVFADGGYAGDKLREALRKIGKSKWTVEIINVEYVDQTTRTNNAAPQTEGALKAESAYAWELKNLPIRTIAHWTKASVQILADAPQLQSIIDTELRYGLAIAEENQLLNGDGVSPNLDGLLTNAAAYVADFTPTSETMIDKVGLGMLQVTLADYVPNGVVLHPSAWMRIRLLKNADGEYLLGDPQSNPNPLLFGLPVVATTAIAKDTFLVGDFRRAGTLYDREQATVALSTEDGDNFVRNLVTIRAEERLGLAVKNPTAMSLGDFGNIT